MAGHSFFSPHLTYIDLCRPHHTPVKEKYVCSIQSLSHLFMGFYVWLSRQCKIKGEMIIKKGAQIDKLVMKGERRYVIFSSAPSIQTFTSSLNSFCS